jgi:serine/threonine-protein phosphatase 2B catalytic subunit
VRNCSYFYGTTAIRKFLEKNRLTSIIRAHQVQAEGYGLLQFGRQSEFPPVITIFSASNYC